MNQKTDSIQEFSMQHRDVDPEETREWMESFDSLVREHGVERAHFILTALLKRARVDNIDLPALVQTPYINTISPDQEPAYPGDERLEKRIRRYIRWNAMAMVVKANKHNAGLGGHLSSYASAANLYEVGFNHFFRGKDHPGGGDHVYFQGHASPGVYARAFLEGRFSEDRMLHFRREVVRGQGLSSYPHPYLMPDFWEFPTVSMGLGPLAAIYQARFNRYLHHRGIKDTSDQRVWAFLGDGECDEPESLGCLHLAAREKLNNLVFVVNCNLQRLDGPVRGNGKIIQELEAVFNGAGWNVIKVVWGREWDALLAADRDGTLIRRMGRAVDGDYQKYSVESGSYTREHFFGSDPRLLKLVEHLSDDDIYRLRRGGHDLRKVHAAFLKATQDPDQPTVILAKTVKGWTLGEGAEARNVAHQAKKMSLKALKVFRDRLFLDIPDADLEDPPLLRFSKDSEPYKYLQERRAELGGYVPERRVQVVVLDTPEIDWFSRFLAGSGEQEASTTGVFARILAQLLNHKALGKRIVPIIPDEARTFGLDALFNRYGIYSSKGQLYTPVDSKMLLKYREALDGQVLQEGICEAGAMGSFIAAGSSYATHGEPMIPFYAFYSQFGFQRIGDQAWAAGDQRVRGFLIGATFGRTTLSGEGLQHQDGHSHLLASTNPAIRAYEPAFAFELALMIQRGIELMHRDGQDVIYYLTVANESYVQPPMPEGVTEDLLSGIYRFKAGPLKKGRKKLLRAHLLGSGTLINETLRAADLLLEQFGVSCDVWSATSYSELRRDALSCERWNTLHPGDAPRVPALNRILGDLDGPAVAASDNMCAVPDQIARWVPGGLLTFGTDGFGRSDTRTALRRHFEIDAEHLVVGVLRRLADAGTIDRSVVAGAIESLGLDADKPDPATA
ncbi:MAG: pyruvate dehydrogenase E1 component [Myxococcota bacterium]|jgi:pyruvate dehydrogenase E1 component